MKTIISLLTVLTIATVSSAKIVGEELDYEHDGVTFKGYLAYDDATSDPRPGVLVVHEWWGHNDYARKRARMLAKMGYVALAVDMYGDGKQAAHPGDAGKFSGAVMKNMDTAKGRFDAGLKTLRDHKRVDAKKTAAIGYCFGGGVVLNMARMGSDINGVASFHGSLGAKASAEKDAITAKLLICHGADDTFIPPDAVATFKKEMDDAQADYEFISYDGATHSFTNPDADAMGKQFEIPIAYNKEADKASWRSLENFLNKLFE
jgi:dienelactone hydrolase